jgi:phage shock protein A
LIKAEDVIALCSSLAKYRKSLEKEIERQKLFQKKYPVHEVRHKSREDCYQNALNIFNSLVGEKT